MRRQKLDPAQPHGFPSTIAREAPILDPVPNGASAYAKQRGGLPNRKQINSRDRRRLGRTLRKRFDRCRELPQREHNRTRPSILVAIKPADRFL